MSIKTRPANPVPPTPHKKLTSWLREQLALDGYENGDPVDHKSIVAHVIFRKREQMQSVGIIRFCWNYTLGGLVRTVLKHGAKRDEEASEEENSDDERTVIAANDGQATFGFYEQMGVHPPLIQLLLAFKAKRVYDATLDRMVCLYTLSHEEVKRAHDFYSKKTVELGNKTEILHQLDQAMNKHGFTHVCKEEE
jgi:hypothetical protein